MEIRQSVKEDGDRVERIIRWLGEKRAEIEGLQKLTIIVDIAGRSVKGQIVPGKEHIE